MRSTMMKNIIATLFVAMLASTVSAGDVVATYGVSANIGNLSVSRQVRPAPSTTVGNSFDYRTLTIGTNPVTFTSTVATAGISLWYNSSSNLLVSVGLTAGAPFTDLYPGECWQGRLATNIVVAWASTNWYGATNLTGTATAAVDSLIISR